MLFRQRLQRLQIFVVCSIIWRNFVIVVRESEAVVLERFQKFNRILRSGINFKWPFIDAGRQFSWTRTEYTADGRADVRMINDVVIDLRESVFNFQEQQVFTKDTVLVDVDAVMYYRIFNVKKAVYEIDDLQSALCNTAQTQLKEVFGNRTFTEALQSQTEINRHMQQEFSKIFARWGVECIRMQLRNLKPNDSQQIAQARAPSAPSPPLAHARARAPARPRGRLGRRCRRHERQLSTQLPPFFFFWRTPCPA